MESRFYVICPRVEEWDPEMQEKKKNTDDPYSVFISMYADYGKLRPLVGFLTGDIVDILQELREINDYSVTHCLNANLFEEKIGLPSKGRRVDLSSRDFLYVLRDNIDRLMKKHNVFHANDFSDQDVFAFYGIISKLK